MRSQTLTLIGALVSVLLVTAFFRFFDRVPYQVQVPPSGEAALNSYLAMQRVMQALGVEAESTRRLDFDSGLFGQTDTIVVNLDNQFVPESRRDRVMAWVENGGHLVLDIRSDYLETSLHDWVQSMGFEIFSDYEYAQELRESYEEDGGEVPSEDATFQFLTYVRLFQFDDTITAKTRSDVLGTYVADFPQGGGRITLIAGDAISINSAQVSSEVDYGFLTDTFSPAAHIVADAVAGASLSGSVWFVYSGDYPSLWGLLIEYADRVLISLAALVILGLWSATRRVGPIRNETPPPRRSIMEHIRASGRFGWRHRGLDALASDARDATLRAADRRDPGVSRASEQTRAKRIARIIGSDAETVSDALSAASGERPAEYTETIARLQKIRNQL